jgi:hypothetical protein
MLKFGILVEGPHKPREKSETRIILLPGSEMGGGECSVHQYTGTDSKTRNTVYKEAL